MLKAGTYPFVTAICKLASHREISKEDKIAFVGDGSGTFFNKIGLTQDLISHGLGIRAKRAAMIVDDLKVTYLGVEPAYTLS